MQPFQCLTRDGASPDSKPRVWLSVHPADRYKYFECLSQAILSAYDCAVYFDFSPDENTKVDLTDFKLTVIAVTEKYLTWQNSGFSSECLNAIEQNIPLLPIMLESGIVNLFNTRCGKLQYIDFASSDMSEQSCEMLRCHLQTAFASSITADQTPAFKQVFVSYRKKDSDELSRLVSLIQSKPEARHIHLWYDTSLTPGENYSDAITDALCNCDLYLLLVTPSLLEKNNYVMRVEYPMAKEKRKTILPIEMQKTDRAKLSACYPDLPKCITDKQIDALFAKLFLH